jgi:hypothetical protein
MLRTPAIVALMSFSGAATSAQTLGTATYSLRFGNGLNTITLGPGQSTTVSVFVSFDPGIGAWIGSAPPLQGEIRGLHNGGFSITGSSVGGGTGNFSVPPGTGHPALQAPWNFLPGIATNQGTSSGASHNGVLWGHAFMGGSPAHPLPVNPALLWKGTFTIGAGSTSGQIDLAFTGLATTGIDVSSGPPSQGGIPWVADFASNPGIGGTIIVPAPASLALLGIGWILTMPRRRPRCRSLRPDQATLEGSVVPPGACS